MLMRDFPKGRVLGRVRHWVRRFSSLQIGLHAAGACYFLVLAAFPTLLLLLGLLRHTALPLGTLIAALEGFLPEALLPYAEALIGSIYRNTSGAVLSVSAVTALWSASRGLHGLFAGLMAVYDVRDDRNYLQARLRSLGYTFAFLLVLVLTLVLHVFGTAIVEGLRTASHPFIRFLAGLVDLRFVLLLLLQTALFTAMFTAIPKDPSGPLDSLPGALVASFGWLVFSRGYSLYLDYFGDSTNLYGSMYALALTMLWLYCCVCLVFFGGAVNRFLAECR